MTVVDFDRDRWRRERNRVLTEENEHLRSYRDRLERILALVTKALANTTGGDPLALLTVFEELDNQANEANVRDASALGQQEFLALLRDPTCTP